MPTYGYRCNACGNDFELWQRMSDEPKADCPVCGGPGRRIFYPAGIVFKGSGFYKTDSRGGSSGSPAKDSGTSTGSGGAAPKSTDSASSGPADGGSSKGTSSTSSGSPD